MHINELEHKILQVSKSADQAFYWLDLAIELGDNLFEHQNLYDLYVSKYTEWTKANYESLKEDKMEWVDSKLTIHMLCSRPMTFHKGLSELFVLYGCSSTPRHDIYTLKNKDVPVLAMNIMAHMSVHEYLNMPDSSALRDTAALYIREWLLNAPRYVDEVTRLYSSGELNTMYGSYVSSLRDEHLLDHVYTLLKKGNVSADSEVSIALLYMSNLFNYEFLGSDALDTLRLIQKDYVLPQLYDKYNVLMSLMPENTQMPFEELSRLLTCTTPAHSEPVPSISYGA